MLNSSRGVTLFALVCVFFSAIAQASQKTQTLYVNLLKGDFPDCSTPFGKVHSYFESRINDGAVATTLGIGQPVIQFNPQVLKQLSPATAIFLWAHECEHHRQGHIVELLHRVRTQGSRSVAHESENEKRADCAAISELMQTNVFDPQDLNQVLQEVRVFARADAAHMDPIQRSDFIKKCSQKTPQPQITEKHADTDSGKFATGAEITEFVPQVVDIQGLQIVKGVFHIDLNVDVSAQNENTRQEGIDSVKHYLDHEKDKTCHTSLDRAHFSYLGKSVTAHPNFIVGADKMLTQTYPPIQCRREREADDTVYYHCESRGKAQIQCPGSIRFSAEVEKTEKQKLASFERNLAELRKDCETKNDLAQCFQAANFYLLKSGVHQNEKPTPIPASFEADPEKARVFLIKACDARHFDSCALLGSEYWTGIYLSKIWIRAKDYLKKSCEGKSPFGCYHYGRFLRDPLNPYRTAETEKEALRIFNLACDEYRFDLACVELEKKN